MKMIMVSKTAEKTNCKVCMICFSDRILLKNICIYIHICIYVFYIYLFKFAPRSFIRSLQKQFSYRLAIYILEDLKFSVIPWRPKTHRFYYTFIFIAKVVPQNTDKNQTNHQKAVHCFCFFFFSHFNFLKFGSKTLTAKYLL